MHTLEQNSQNNPVVKWGLITLAIVAIVPGTFLPLF